MNKKIFFACLLFVPCFGMYKYLPKPRHRQQLSDVFENGESQITSSATTPKAAQAIKKLDFKELAERASQECVPQQRLKPSSSAPLLKTKNKLAVLRVKSQSKSPYNSVVCVIPSAIKPKKKKSSVALARERARNEAELLRRLHRTMKMYR